MKRVRVLIFCLLAIAAPRSCFARGAGGEPFNFLFLDADARAVGMGGAYTALANDANALLYNPAGLGRIGANEVTFMENRYVRGVSQEYLGFASKLGFGLNLNHLSFGEIPRTTVSDPDGSGSFGIRDLALGLGYGRTVRPGLSLGAGAKYIRESIDDVSASGYALDLGALYSMPGISGLTLGLAVQNIGPAVKFHNAEENLPLNARLGAAYKLKNLYLPTTFAFDVTKERSESPLFFIGTEVLAANTMPIRLGFNTRNDAGTGVTFGLGWIYRRFRLNYAFMPLGELGASHRFSVTVKFIGPPPLPPTFESTQPDHIAIPPDPGQMEQRSADIDAHFRKIDKYLRKGALPQAKAELQEADLLITDKDPRSVRYFERLGRIFFMEKDFHYAQVGYTRAIRRARELGVSNDAVTDAYVGMGLCLLERENILYAEKFFKKALETSPSEKARGLILRKLSEIENLKKSPTR